MSKIKLKEFADIYGNMRVDIQELKDFLGYEKKEFIPEEGEEYWCIDEFGEIYFNYFIEFDDQQERVIKHNEVYRTEQEAKFQRDKNLFLIKMKRDFANNSDEIDINKKLYSIIYYTKLDEVSIVELDNILHGGLYTTNIKWLEKYIEEHEEDIKKYYFELDLEEE